MILVELCAGTACVGLSALACRTVAPPVGYMGSKRRWARDLVGVLTGWERVDRLVLVDAGPWGDVWTVLRDADARRDVALRLDRLAEKDLTEVWPFLVLLDPPADPVDRVAQYLCLQARSAGCIPIWWSVERRRWESPTGARTEAAHQRGGGGTSAALHRAKSAGRKVGKAYQAGDDRLRSRGLVDIGTISRRVRSLDRIPWERVDVVHGDILDVQPIPGATVYFDPPYAHSPRYAATLMRTEVINVAQSWAGAGCRVAVSEAEPLSLDGWDSWRLPGHKPEWVTARGLGRPAEQLRMIESNTEAA